MFCGHTGRGTLIRAVVRVHGMQGLDAHQRGLLQQARQFFVGHTEAVGVLLVEGADPMFIKSGIDGGPWGGTHRGGIPRLPGWAFTRGGPSQGNIATHVEGHAAAIMWQRGLTRATLLVDRPMCKICDRNIPSTLPPGSFLSVLSEEEGLTMVRSSHAV
jgi:hypothetical protein